MYSLLDYSSMIVSRPRMAAYEQALRASIQPGCTVLDIGAGMGIMAFAACQMGAGHVYAVEPSSAIEVARAIARANGLADRVSFFQALSTHVELPQRVDVIVSDLRGVLPLFQHHIPAIMDARTRLLAPLGVLIPHRDTLWIAPVHAPTHYQKFVLPWDERPYGLSMETARNLTVNTWSRARFTHDQLVCEPKTLTVLDYKTIVDSDMNATIEWTVTHGGLAHGFCVWFDTELIEGIGYSNAPGEPELIYSSAFFPWEQAVELGVGDRIDATLSANLIADDYIWRWQTKIETSTGKRKTFFDQSTFYGEPLTIDQLRKRSATYVPRLSQNGHVDLFSLQLMESGATIAEIAQQLYERFPDHFQDERSALAYAADLSQKYGQ